MSGDDYMDPGPANNPANKQVGDLTSNEKGSGARFNSGKPDYSLLDMRHLALVYANEGAMKLSIDRLGRYQFSGSLDDLLQSYHFALSAAQQAYDSSTLPHTEEYFMDHVCRVWEYGKIKYDAWNWAKGMPWDVCVACIGRHFRKAYLIGEYIDDESEQPHWAHILCNLQMLMLYGTEYPEGNNLPFALIDQS